MIPACVATIYPIVGAAMRLYYLLHSYNVFSLDECPRRDPGNHPTTRGSKHSDILNNEFVSKCEQRIWLERVDTRRCSREC